MRIVFLVSCLCLLSYAKATPYLSPDSVAVGRDGKTLFVTAATGKAVLLVDAALKQVRKRVSLPDNPTGLAVSADGKTLYITAGVVDGQLLILDAESGTISRQIPLGHSPVAPTPTRDNQTLYFANLYLNRVAKLDLASGRIINTRQVVREPNSLVLSPDETTLFVGNHLPAGRANGDRISCCISLLDTVTFSHKKTIRLVNGTINLRSMHLSPDGRWIFVPSYIARFSVPTTQLERGWMNTSAMSVIDVRDEVLHHAFLMDDVDQGAANPWAVAITPENAYICVSHSSIEQVSVIDYKGLFEKLSKSKPASDYPSLEEYEAAGDSPVNRLDYMVGIRRRVNIKGHAPRGIVALKNTVVTANYYTDDISSFTIDAPEDVTVIPLQERQPLTAERQGAIYFNDATYCFQKWQSCSCCHPDGRADAVNWDLLNDGMGNPKNTKSMLFAHQTPPVMITGIRPKAETAVRAGIKYIMFAPVDEDRANAIDAYLRSLRPVPSPYLENGKLSTAAVRGKAVFENANCNKCHSGHYYTNLKQYDVGTAVDGQDKGKPFDTPTLVEVWRTAPYLFDGRAATLKEVFTQFNKENRHGITTTLSEKEIDDLVAYLKSL